MNRIIYKTEDGTVVVIIPTQEALNLYSIQDIAIKDVPKGKSYKIVDAAYIPLDRTFREAWTVDDTVLTDGVGGESNEFQEVTE